MVNQVHEDHQENKDRQEEDVARNSKTQENSRARVNFPRLFFKEREKRVNVGFQAYQSLVKRVKLAYKVFFYRLYHFIHKHSHSRVVGPSIFVNWFMN